MAGFRYDKHAGTTRASSASSASAAASTGATPPTSRPPQAHPALLRHEAVELLHPGAAVAVHARRRWNGSTSASGHDVRPRARRRSCATRALLPARAWSSRRPCTSPACSARAPPRRLRRLGVAAADGRARRCSSRRTSPAGTTSGGSTRARGAGAGWRPTTCWRAAASRPTPRSPATRAPARSARPEARRPRAPLLGQADAEPRDPPRARRLRPSAPPRRPTSEWEQESYAILRQNALRMLIATTRTCTRADGPPLPRLLPRPTRARAGARPARDRARHARSGRERARRAAASCCAPPASRSPSTAAAGSRPLEAEAALAQGRRRRPRARAGLPRRRRSTRVSFLAPTEDATYRRLRPRLALPPGAGTPVRGGRAAALASVRGARWPRCTREGKVSVMPAVGYEHPDQSHFVSRHFHEVGALDPKLAHGLDGPLPRPRRRARQPAPGPRARPHARARARLRARARSPPSPSPATTTSGRATCGATSRR